MLLQFCHTFFPFMTLLVEIYFFSTFKPSSHTLCCMFVCHRWPTQSSSQVLIFSIHQNIFLFANHHHDRWKSVSDRCLTAWLSWVTRVPWKRYNHNKIGHSVRIWSTTCRTHVQDVSVSQTPGHQYISLWLCQCFLANEHCVIQLPLCLPLNILT